MTVQLQKKYVICNCIELMIGKHLYSLQRRHIGFMELQSLITRLFVQQPTQVKSKENVKVLHNLPYIGGKPPMTNGFHLERDSNVESVSMLSLRWRHNGRDSVSNHQHYDYLLNRLFRRRSKKTSKLRVTGHCVGNSSGTGEFPAQMASNAENDVIIKPCDKWNQLRSAFHLVQPFQIY